MIKEKVLKEMFPKKFGNEQVDVLEPMIAEKAIDLTLEEVEKVIDEWVDEFNDDRDPYEGQGQIYEDEVKKLKLRLTGDKRK